MSDTIRSAKVRIGALDFDPQTRMVDVKGRKTLLDARSSGVLLALAEHFGDCVTKDTLMRAGWPKQLVHENSLAKAISKLRGAIDGAGIEIAAAYGVGYTLRDAVDQGVEAKPAPPEAAPATRERSRPQSATVLMISICAALLTAAVGIFAVDSLNQTVPVRRSPPITNDPPNAIATVLWVDDHPSNNALEVEVLRRRRVAVHLAKSTGDALTLLGINRYKLVVSDLGRGEDRLAGLRMIAAMKQRGMAVPVIIYTVRPKDRFGQEQLRRLVTGAGASGLAVTPQEVRSTIARQLGPTAEGARRAIEPRTNLGRQILI